jgi:hypothetical protein
MGNLQEQNDLLANTEPDVLMHDQTIPYYSRKTVESLLASLTKEHEQRTEECRKQALHEAEDVCAEIAEKCAYDPAQDAVIRCCDELRRMAEGKSDE